MHIVTLVNRDLGRAVRRAANAARSPYFAQGDLARSLQTLHHNLRRLAERRPDLLSALAEHLGTEASTAAVTQAVDDSTAALLARRIDADIERIRRARHHNVNCSP